MWCTFPFWPAPDGFKQIILHRPHLPLAWRATNGWKGLIFLSSTFFMCPPLEKFHFSTDRCQPFLCLGEFGRPTCPCGSCLIGSRPRRAPAASRVCTGRQMSEAFAVCCLWQTSASQKVGDGEKLLCDTTRWQGRWVFFQCVSQLTMIYDLLLPSCPEVGLNYIDGFSSFPTANGLSAGCKYGSLDSLIQI